LLEADKSAKASSTSSFSELQAASEEQS
jgi:hypothetical protein